jgi:tetratricopeptide (TPR) repeat protein
MPTVPVLLGRPDEALDSFDRAIAIEPRYAEAHNNRGGVLRERGDQEAALASFDRAVALNPDYALAHCNRGMVLNELCRPKQALASMDRAIALAPNRQTLIVAALARFSVSSSSTRPD